MVPAPSSAWKSLAAVPQTGRWIRRALQAPGWPSLRGPQLQAQGTPVEELDSAAGLERGPSGVEPSAERQLDSNIGRSSMLATQAVARTADGAAGIRLT